jgi:hypothetical protein
LLIFLFCIFLINVFFSGCEKQMNKNPVLEQSHFNTSDINNDILLSIKDNSITPETKEITLVFKNKSKVEYIYGGVDYLEKEIDGKWYSLPSKENVQWDMLAYKLKAEAVAESNFSIKTYYGDLTKGKYRIIKEVSQIDNIKIKSYVIVKFSIR